MNARIACLRPTHSANSTNRRAQQCKYSLDPTEVGVTFIRKVSLAGNKLTLITKKDPGDGGIRYNG